MRRLDRGRRFNFQEKPVMKGGNRNDGTCRSVLADPLRTKPVERRPMRDVCDVDPHL